MVGRFINADDVSLLTESLEDLTDKNLYAYCDNNPINRSDDDGEIWNFVVMGLVSAAIEVGSQLASGKKLKQVNWSKVAFEGVTGSVGGPGKAIAKLAVKGAAKATGAGAAKAVAKAATTTKKIHGNSHKTTKPTLLYALVKKDTGKIMKFGETTNPRKRYSQKYLNRKNVRMVPIMWGTKKSMYYRQGRLIKGYQKAYGSRPPWNKGYR